MAKKGEVKHNKKELDKRARETAVRNYSSSQNICGCPYSRDAWLCSQMKNGGAGGGKKDADARKSKTMKCLIKCTICLGQQPNVHSMGIHYEAKHSKIKWDDVKAGYEAMAAGQ